MVLVTAPQQSVDEAVRKALPLMVCLALAPRDTSSGKDIVDLMDVPDADSRLGLQGNDEWRASQVLMQSPTRRIIIVSNRVLTMIIVSHVGIHNHA
jgi:hypothetical protein